MKSSRAIRRACASRSSAAGLLRQLALIADPAAWIAAQAIDDEADDAAEPAAGAADAPAAWPGPAADDGDQLDEHAARIVKRFDAASRLKSARAAARTRAARRERGRQRRQSNPK